MTTFRHLATLSLLAVAVHAGHASASHVGPGASNPHPATAPQPHALADGAEIFENLTEAAPVIRPAASTHHGLHCKRSTLPYPGNCPLQQRIGLIF